MNGTLEFTKSKWRNADGFIEFVNTMVDLSLYQNNVVISDGNQLVTLVACDTRDGNKIIIVIGNNFK